MSRCQQINLSGQRFKPKNKRARFLIITLLVALALATVIVYQPLSQTLQSTPALPQVSLQSSQQEPLIEPWMVRGTYAIYQGQIVGVSTPVNVHGKMQVTDLNATHVKIQTDMNMSTPFAPSIADRTIQWVDKTNIAFQPKGETLARAYDTQITITAIESRSCIAYDYINEAINATYYVDKTLQWPIKIVYTTTFENKSYTIETSLTETNIQGL